MARSSRQDTRRGGFVYLPQRYELHLANKPGDDRFEWKGVERRRATRKTVDQTVMISLSGGAKVTPCAMRNLSVLGAGLLLENTSIPSTGFDLSFDDFRTSFACRVVWRRDAFVGVEFVQ